MQGYPLQWSAEAINGSPSFVPTLVLMTTVLYRQPLSKPFLWIHWSCQGRIPPIFLRSPSGCLCLELLKQLLTRVHSKHSPLGHWWDGTLRSGHSAHVVRARIASRTAFHSLDTAGDPHRQHPPPCQLLLSRAAVAVPLTTGNQATYTQSFNQFNLF